MLEDDEIDTLLARYLEMLHTYTTLRTELSELQSSVYHSLARANFSAERGIRYGQDFYDERMQATKVLDTENSEDGLPKFELVNLNATPPTDTNEAETENASEDIAQKMEQTTLTSESNSSSPESSAENDHKNKSTTTTEPSRSPKSKDPLRWFGILSPPSLRQAQSGASMLVETAVKLSSIDAEMRGVEIEIRRARKRKMKAGSGKVVDKNTVGSIVREDGLNREAEAKPFKVNRGGGCGRVAM